jgi:hypothetical protein
MLIKIDYRKRVPLETLNEYPNYLVEYFYTLLRPVIGTLLCVCSKLISDPKARKFLFKEFMSGMKKIFVPVLKFS